MSKYKKFKKEVKACSSAMLNMPGHHSVAGVSWYINGKFEATVDAESKKDGDKRGTVNIDAAVTISDCFKQVKLDFNTDTYHRPNKEDKDDRRNAVHKITTLIEHLTQFREKLLEAHKLYQLSRQFHEGIKDEDDEESEAVTFEEVIRLAHEHLV